MNTHRYACMAILLMAAGCKTPQVALDEANHGLSLTTELKSALSSYAIRQAAIDDMRKQQLGANIHTYNIRLLGQPADDQLYDISGQGQRLLVIKQLRSRIVLLRVEAETRQANNARLAQLQGSLVTALPPVGATLGATGKAFGALGTELPFFERATLAKTFVDDVNKTVRQNREAASAATAQEAKDLAGQDQTASTINP